MFGLFDTDMSKTGYLFKQMETAVLDEGSRGLPKSEFTSLFRNDRELERHKQMLFESEKMFRWNPPRPAGAKGRAAEHFVHAKFWDRENACPTVVEQEISATTVRLTSLIQQFIDTRCVIEPDVKIDTPTLFKAFKTGAAPECLKNLTESWGLLRSELERRGVEVILEGDAVRGFCGVRVRNEDESPAAGQHRAGGYSFYCFLFFLEVKKKECPGL